MLLLKTTFSMNLSAIGSLHQGEIVPDQPELMTFTRRFAASG